MRIYRRVIPLVTSPPRYVANLVRNKKRPLSSARTTPHFTVLIWFRIKDLMKQRKPLTEISCHSSLWSLARSKRYSIITIAAVGNTIFKSKCSSILVRSSNRAENYSRITNMVVSRPLRHMLSSQMHFKDLPRMRRIPNLVY